MPSADVTDEDRKYRMKGKPLVNYFLQENHVGGLKTKMKSFY
jgi:hypothetical protein